MKRRALKSLNVDLNASAARWLKITGTVIFAKTENLSCYINPSALELDIYSLAHHLCKMWIILGTKRGNIRKYTTFCGGINEDGQRKSKKKKNN